MKASAGAWQKRLRDPRAYVSERPVTCLFALTLQSSGAEATVEQKLVAWHPFTSASLRDAT